MAFVNDKPYKFPEIGKLRNISDICIYGIGCASNSMTVICAYLKFANERLILLKCKMQCSPEAWDAQHFLRYGSREKVIFYVPVQNRMNREKNISREESSKKLLKPLQYGSPDGKGLYKQIFHSKCYKWHSWEEYKSLRGRSCKTSSVPDSWLTCRRLPTETVSCHSDKVTIIKMAVQLERRRTHRVVRRDKFSIDGGSRSLKLLLDKSL